MRNLPLYALGLIGNDAYGDYLVEQCRRFPNINLDQLRRTDLDATSYTDVFSIKASGRRTYFHYPGTNRLFQPAHVDLDTLPVKMFHLGYLLLMDAMDQPDAEFGTVAARFLAQLQAAAIRTSIDLVSEEQQPLPPHRAPRAEVHRLLHHQRLGSGEADRHPPAGGGQAASRKPGQDWRDHSRLRS